MRGSILKRPDFPPKKFRRFCSKKGASRESLPPRFPRRPLLRAKSSEEVQKILLEEGGVAGIAGAAFGPGGRNYLRFSLVSARNLLEEALERMQRVSVHWRTAVSR